AAGVREDLLRTAGTAGAAAHICLTYNRTSRSSRVQPSRFFRAGVGAVFANERGDVLACERRDIAGAWQFPQGGLKDGEAPIEAVRREILEETGITRDHLRLMTECPDLLVYELPPSAWSRKTGRGQVQRWFMFAYQGRLAIVPPLDSEF